MLHRTLPLLLPIVIVACGGGASPTGSTVAIGAAGTSPTGQGGGQAGGTGAGSGTGGVAGSQGGGVGDGAGGAAVGVGGAAAGAAGTGAGGASGAGGSPFAPCKGTTTTTLPGVTLTFPPDVQCAYTTTEVAGGIKIPYRLNIDAAAAGVSVSNAAQASCETPGPSGLFVFERLSGMGQDYCVCDSGLCMPPATQTLASGPYPMAFAWDGKNWSGPSDTGNPKGAPFPQGSYVLTVRAAGTTGAGTPFEVTATLNIMLLGKCGPCAPGRFEPGLMAEPR